MKNFTATLVILVGLLCCSAAQAQVISMGPVLKRTLEVINIMEKHNIQPISVSVDYIQQSKYRDITMTLDGMIEYHIVAVGDDTRVADLDLIIYDENNNLIQKDQSNENLALVSFTPKWTGKFTIRSSAYLMKSGYTDGLFGMIVGFTR